MRLWVFVHAILCNSYPSVCFRHQGLDGMEVMWNVDLSGYNTQVLRAFRAFQINAPFVHAALLTTITSTNRMVTSLLLVLVELS